MPRSRVSVCKIRLALGHDFCRRCVQCSASSSFPWRGILVAYSLTQIAARLPITPGGLRAVEGSLAALLVAYGLGTGQAPVSFWGLVPIGRVMWAGLELAQRQGARSKVHPWAVHLHGAEPTQAALGRKGPDRVLNPELCVGCDEQGRPERPDEKIAG